MARLTWWLRVVGVFYLLQFVMMAFAHAPIRTFGPDGALDRAEAGEPLAEFLVDTWRSFGLEVAAVGMALLVASRRRHLVPGVVWTVLAIEVLRGVVNDVQFIVRGVEVAGYAVWIVIHSVVIVTGLLALRTERAERSAPVPSGLVTSP